MKIDDIVAQIAQKTGISNDQARSAFMASLEFVKGKLPDSVGSQLTGLLEGKEFDFNALLKDQLSQAKDKAQDKFEDLKGDAKEKFDDLKDGAKGLMDKLF
jgi:uncharacterized protein YjbJ (UPF0337 family)